MSPSSSPYAQPVQDSPPPPGSPTSTTTIVGIVALTVLLVCGGVIGLGFYAVDRLADQLSEYAEYRDQWDDNGSALAIEYAVEESPQIIEKVGEIESVELDHDLTYGGNSNDSEFFYRIHGAAGNALVAVEFSENDKRWFSRVSLAEDQTVDGPRTPLQSRRVPFDTQWSKRICDVLEANDNELAETLDIGPIRWIVYDYELSSDRAISQELVFTIEGESGSIKIVARFKDLKYVTVDSIQVVDDNDELGEAIYEGSPSAERDEAKSHSNELDAANHFRSQMTFACIDASSLPKVHGGQLRVG